MKKLYLSLLLCSGLVSAQSLELVKDINVGAGSSSVSNFAIMDGKLYFQASNGTTAGTGLGPELWMSDGTEAGTSIVQDYIVGTTGFSPSNIKAFGSKLFFQGAGGTSTGLPGYELYTYDTTNGIQLFADIEVGTTGSFPSNFTEFGGKLYFKANQNGYPRLYVTDGVNPPTIVSTDISLSTSTVGWTGIAATSSKLLFGAGTSSSVLQLYGYDGVETKLVKTINATATSGINNMYSATSLNKVFFVANDGVNGNEAWVTDGTEVGTFMIKDIYPGTGNALSSPTFFEFNSKVYFPATDNVKGTELWVTDGTSAGTKLVKDINEGTGGSSPANFAVYKNKLYFVASTASEGRELWETDGTEAGTKLVKDFIIGTNSPNLASFVVFDNDLYAYGSTGNNAIGSELLKVNISDISLGINHSFAREKPIIFPNPSNGDFSVSHLEQGNYEIYDMNGRLVANGMMHNGKVNSKLDKGEYIVKIISNKGNFSAKILILK